MDWEKTWKQLESENKGGLEPYLEHGKQFKKESRHPLHSIRRSLVITSVWAIVISAGYIYLMFRFPYWQLLLGFSIVLLFNFYSVIKGIQLYRSIPANISGNTSLLAEMEKQYHAVLGWISMQKITAIFVYPVAAATGFMLGGMIGSEKPVDLLLTKKFFWISGIIAMVVITPLAHYFAKLLVKYSYGKYLVKLKENIDELRKQESAEMP
ncbi:MAG TPA: hypothetical protein VFX73_05300 [Chitinophagaceae bacterium]|nr:hypothetical protein [Chitinophagaceae bacterium]